MQEAAQPWEPHFVPRETVPETVRYPLSRKPLSRKPTRLKQDKVMQQQQNPPVLSNGARVQGALSGRIKAAATTQPAERIGK